MGDATNPTPASAGSLCASICEETHSAGCPSAAAVAESMAEHDNLDSAGSSSARCSIGCGALHAEPAANASGGAGSEADAGHSLLGSVAVVSPSLLRSPELARGDSESMIGERVFSMIAAHLPHTLSSLRSAGSLGVMRPEGGIVEQGAAAELQARTRECEDNLTVAVAGALEAARHHRVSPAAAAAGHAFLSPDGKLASAAAQSCSAASMPAAAVATASDSARSTAVDTGSGDDETAAAAAGSSGVPACGAGGGSASGGVGSLWRADIGHASGGVSSLWGAEFGSAGGGPGDDASPVAGQAGQRESEHDDAVRLRRVALRLAKPERRDLLGERLYPLVLACLDATGVYPAEHAGKITGMLLEMDADDVVNLIFDGGMLVAQVNEAIRVLGDHVAAGGAGPWPQAVRIEPAAAANAISSAAEAAARRSRAARPFPAAAQALLLAVAPASHEVRRDRLGERLYPLVTQQLRAIGLYTSQRAGKITGMLLEMEPAQVVSMVYFPDELAEQVDRAMQVLRAAAGDRPAEQ